MKLHRPLISAVSQALKDVFANDLPADDVVRVLLSSQRKWGSRDRRWVAETIYDIVRWYRLYCHLSGQEYTFPEHIDWEQLIAAVYRYKGIELDNPELLGNIKIDEFADPAVRSAVSASYPDWLYELGEIELGEKWPETAEALNHPAEVYLRCNTLKTNRDTLVSLFEEAGVPMETDNRSENAIRLTKRVNILSSPLFKSGYFEIQDIASQQVSLLCNPAENDLIADVCAGGGGKSLHLAALAGKRATILASDISITRLNKVKERAKRAGADNIKIIEQEGLPDYTGKCDIVLIDAPCSGTGVIRRNPDTKWKLSSEKLQALQITQAELLKQHFTLLKPGGKLVYATCSVFPSEGEMQVSQFLESHPFFILQEEKRYWPQDGYDGFYIAVFMKD